jgi:uncharacterized repeat protein (TIGR04138 family)
MSDPRYAVEAYEFLCQALAYTQQVIRPWNKRAKAERRADPGVGSDSESPAVQHVTGQDLCEGIRQFAMDQFGLMAPVVLQCWGIRSTSDFGKMVYHLIDAGLWHKSETDSIEDFDDCFDIQTAFREDMIEWRAES